MSISPEGGGGVRDRSNGASSCCIAPQPLPCGAVFFCGVPGVCEIAQFCSCGLNVAQGRCASVGVALTMYECETTCVGCLVPEARLESVRADYGAADFKSAVSTNFTTRAYGGPPASRTRHQRIMSLLVEFQPLKNQTFTRAKLLFLLR